MLDVTCVKGGSTVSQPKTRKKHLRWSWGAWEGVDTILAMAFIGSLSGELSALPFYFNCAATEGNSLQGATDGMDAFGLSRSQLGNGSLLDRETAPNTSGIKL